MVEHVAQFMRSHGLLQAGSHVVAACSGGADSLALLDILLALRKKLSLTVTVAHFEHGIRGGESRADAAFVEAFARARGASFQLGSEDVPAYAKRKQMSLELAARECRYAFLWQVVEGSGADALATAHHADDQAETVLMRILRGTGIDGLAAMRPRNGRHIRPLLAVTRAEIEAYCRERGLAPRHDATNDSADCMRNALRLDVLPYLRAHANPAVSHALCQLAEIAEAENDCLDAMLDQAWPGLLKTRDGQADGPAKKYLWHTPFCALPLALQRRALRRLWRTAGEEQDLAFAHVEALRMLFLTGETGSGLDLPHGRRAEVSYGRLLILPRRLAAEKAPAPTSVRVPGVAIWGKWKLTASLLKAPPERIGSDAFCLAAPPPEGLCLRGRMAGDFMRLASGRKKLKEVWIDDKIPREERSRIPLLAVGREVLWIAGHRRSAAHQPAGNVPIVYCRVTSREQNEHDG